MRIAFVCYRGNMQAGGQGVYLHALTRELARAGHEIDVFVGPPWPDPMPWARVERIANDMYWGARFNPSPGSFLPEGDPFRVLQPLGFFEYAVTRFGFFPEPFAFSMRAARAVLARLRGGTRYDLVHDVQSVSYGLLWLQALGLPVVSTIHHPLSVDLRSSLARDRSFEEYKGSLTFHPVRTQARTARRLAGVLTSSEVSREQICADFGVARERLHNVRNGVQLPPPGGPRGRPDPPELLFAGRCGDPNKGIEFLLSALALLPAKVGLCCLDREPDGTPIAQQIRDLGLRDRVRFVGKIPQDDLWRAYRESAAVVMPSLYEGFGLPAIEALAAGTPVVASAAGALPEVLDAAGVGRRVPPRDPRALAAAISELLGDWEREQGLVLAARAQIERVFGWPEVARRSVEVYEAVVDDWRARRGAGRAA